MIGRHRMLLITLFFVFVSAVHPLPQRACAEDEPASVAKVDESPGARHQNRSAAVVASITISVLAVFVGFELITKIPPTLHTPLMSGSNAISGITIVGAVLSAGAMQSTAVAVIGMIAVILATINAVGGFLVTDRMLGMFCKK